MAQSDRSHAEVAQQARAYLEQKYH